MGNFSLLKRLSQKHPSSQVLTNLLFVVIMDLIMFKNSRLVILLSKSLLTTILSLSLFFGGIALLLAKIPGWSLFFGLIITPLGFVFTIFTLDEVAKNLVVPPPFKPVRCNVCGKTTYAKEEEEDVICGRCRKDISEKLLEEI